MFLLTKNINEKKLARYKALPDLELIDKYKLFKDLDCFEELFNRYTYLVFGVCLKYLKNESDAEDAVMQIFEGLFEKLESYKIENFKGWLYSVTKNHCLMYLRKIKTEKRIQEKFYEKNEKTFMEFMPEIHLNFTDEKSENVNELFDVVNNLKEEQKNCLTLMYLENKTYKEVAELTGYSLNQVKSYIQNGKRNLKNILGDKNEI